MKGRFLFFLLAMILCASSVATVKQNNITAIKTTEFNGTTHIVFRLSKIQKPRIFALSNPDRLVLDFENTHFIEHCVI